MSEQDTTPEDVEDVDTDPVDDEVLDGADQLADPGKKALDAMKAKWRAERELRKAAEAKITDKPVEDPKDKPDPAKLLEQARVEARAEVLKDRALDKVEAKAAKLFADPEDARALLAAAVEEFIDGDKLDLEAIEDALTDLLKRKPHLAATAAPRFAGSADGGARKGSGKPQQLTANDLKRMTSRQIVDAQEKGQFDDLLGNT